MTYSKNPAKENLSGYLYTRGKENTDGSIRLSINPFTGIAGIEERENGIWKPASFETDSASVWVGPRVGIGGVGRHLVTQDSDSNRDLYFFAHNSFDGELSTSEAKIICAYDFKIRDIVVSDDSGEWIGTVYTYNYPSPDHRMLAKAYYKTGAIAATSPVRLQVWGGVDDTGPVVFDQTYTADIFIANSEIIITPNGFVEFEKDLNYYVMMSSDNDFSLRTTFDEVFPWTAGDISMVREDDILQATPYVDEDNFTKGQWAIQNQRVYECNVTGVQTGTFEDNTDKWDALSPGIFALSRSNHTGTQSASTISDFDTKVENNPAVALNTAKKSNVQSDWDQSDNSKDDYIKNKPLNLTGKFRFPLLFVKNANLANGIHMVLGEVTTTPTHGFIVPQDLTLETVTIMRTDTDPADLEILYNGSVIATVASADLSVLDDTMSVACAKGGIITVKNKSTSSTMSNVICTLWFEGTIS